MSSGAARDTLQLLHGILAQELIKRIQDGQATASDLSVAAKLLRDNGVVLVGGQASDIADRLAEELPFQEDASDIARADQTAYQN